MTGLKRAARNTVVLYIGKVVGILISTVTLGMITRYLGIEQFGSFSTVLAFSAVIVSINDFGITWIISREIAQGKRDIINAFTSLKLTITVVTIGLGLLVLPLIGYPELVQSGITFVAVYIFFTSLNNLQIGILQGESALDKTAYTDIFSRLVNLGILFAVIKYDLGYYGVLIGLNGAGVATYLSNYYFLRKFNLPAWQFSFAKLQPYQREIALTALLSALSFMVYKSDTLILARLKPPVDVGIYNAAYRILDVIMSVPSIMVGALYPVLSQTLFNPDSDESARTHQIGFTAITMIGALTTAGGILLASVAIRLIAGSSYISTATVNWLGQAVTSVQVLQILAVFVFLAFISSYLNAILILNKKQLSCILANGLGLVINVIGNWYFIPHYSYLACAWLTVATQALITLLLAYAVWKNRLVFGKLTDLIRVILALLASLLSASLGSSTSFSLLIFIPMWIVLTYALGGQPKDTLTKIWVSLSKRLS